MAKLEFGKKLKSGLQGAADAVASSVKDVKKPEIKMPELKKPELKVPDFSAVQQQVKEKFRKQKEETPAAETNAAPLSVIHICSALEILYFLIAADQELKDEETVMFDEIGKAFFGDFDQYKERILEDCRRQLAPTNEMPMDALLKQAADHALQLSEITLRSDEKHVSPVISVKLLIWDMMTVAYCDGECAPEEQELIRYIAEKTELDPTVYLELKSSIETVTDLKKETDWLKTTDRPYLTIEAMVNEIADRRDAVHTGVKDLIML